MKEISELVGCIRMVQAEMRQRVRWGWWELAQVEARMQALRKELV